MFVGKTPPTLRSSDQGASTAEPPAPGLLARDLEAYLADHPAAAVLEDGRILFDLRSARYSVEESHGRCLLQFWSEERNVVRSVMSVQKRSHSLRLLTRKMGTADPQFLELVPDLDRRSPSERDAARRDYLRKLERVFSRHFPGRRVDSFRSAMDLEHSFGPAYARGHLLKGTSAQAVIGIGPTESGAAIQGILTLGLLWLDHCRQHSKARRHFDGLKIVVPSDSWRTTAQRIAWLHHGLAHFELYTLDEQAEELVAVDFRDTGNLESRLTHAFSATAALERCRAGLDRLLHLIPDSVQDRIELHPRSATQVDLLLFGLDFARVRCTADPRAFTRETEISFGAGANETPLNSETEPLCRALLQRLCHNRTPEGNHADPLYRLHAERWLESCIRTHLGVLLPGVRAGMVYAQVPAFTVGDRAMLDLLTLDREARLTVIELKADEDLQLPLQALDYWIRVRALNDDRCAISGTSRPLSTFERQGYFPGVEVSPRPPRLVLLGPALRIHPANEPVLRHLSPEIDWELIAVNEDWRKEVRVVFRKHSHKN